MMTRSKKYPGVVCFILFVLAGVCLARNEIPPEQEKPEQPLFEGFVYYADMERVALKSEMVRLPANLEPLALGREIIETLFAGPSKPGLERLWPEGTTLNAFFISDDGKAYVDLGLAPGMAENMDTRRELLTLYSLVNSLTLNIPGIKMVKILVQGTDALTFGGHLDMDTFYKTNMLIVK
jgi:hypothetical protein